MKRFAILALVAQGLFACKPDVPGATCSKNSDCKSGNCERGLCIEPTCTPGCAAYQDCVASGCTSGFTGLAIDEPAANDQKTAPFSVSATITPRAGTKATPPASVTLTATPATGTAETFTLTLGTGTMKYQGNVAPKGTGAYSLKAHSAEAALDSAEVAITVLASVCSPACTGFKYCAAGHCDAAFTGIAITAPLNAATVTADPDVTVHLARAIGATLDPPGSVSLIATPSGGTELTPLTLTRVAATDDYAGKFTPTVGGQWTLKARSDDLSLTSSEISITADYCPTACLSFQDCITGVCTNAFTELEITQPAAGTVGKSVTIGATLTRLAGSTTSPPSSIDVTVTKGGTDWHVTLNRSGVSFNYSGVWPPLGGDGAYSLVATGANLTSATVIVTVDMSPPTFTIVVNPPPTRPDAAHTDQTSPNAFRRDEDVTILVKSTDTDVDPTTVNLTIVGLSGNPMALPLTADCVLASTPFCKQTTVNLGDPSLEMKAFSGDFTAKAWGSDLLKNDSTPVSQPIPVTRWKWAVDTDPGAGVKAVRSAPAIGTSGRVYVATTSGKAVAMDPDGTVKWTFTSNGASGASIVVGDVSGVETAFVGGADATFGGSIWGITEANYASNPSPICSDGVPGNSVFGSPALTQVQMNLESSASITAVFAVGSTSGLTVFGVRPKGVGIAKRCPPLDVSPNGVAPDSGFAVDATGVVYFGDEAGNINSATLQPSNWHLNWSKSAGGGNQTTNPAIGAGIAGGAGNTSALYRTDSTGTTPTLLTTDGPTWNAVLAASPSGTLLIAGTNLGSLYAVPEAFTSSTTPTMKVALSGKLKGAPAIGSDGTIYVSSDSKKLYALDQQGQTIWVQPGLGMASESSPALDCTRDSSGAILGSRPGVVYVGANDGKLYAFITDSRGIDTTSPWPKFHRDPRNSADASVTLSNFNCQ